MWAVIAAVSSSRRRFVLGVELRLALRGFFAALFPPDYFAVFVAVYDKRFAAFRVGQVIGVGRIVEGDGYAGKRVGTSFGVGYFSPFAVDFAAQLSQPFGIGL